MVQITVLPKNASFLRIFTIFNAVELSSPLVGSSSKRTAGSVISSYPMEVLFRSPPESPFRATPPILVLAQYYKPSLERISSTFCSIIPGPRFVLNLAANMKDSLGVIVSIRMSSC